MILIIILIRPIIFCHRTSIKTQRHKESMQLIDPDSPACVIELNNPSLFRCFSCWCVLHSLSSGSISRFSEAYSTTDNSAQLPILGEYTLLPRTTMRGRGNNRTSRLKCQLESHNIIANLSVRTLTGPETDVLNKGLSFVPNTFTPKSQDISRDLGGFINRLINRLRLKYKLYTREQ